MEKSWPEKKRHPPIRVSFSERLNEEQVDPFARAKSLELCCLSLLGYTVISELAQEPS